MMKLCQNCRGTFAGGDFCPACGVQQPLTDFAGGAAGPHLVDEELNLAVQAHYAERAGMVRSVLAFFLGLLGAFALARAAFGYTGAGRIVFAILAAVTLVGGALLGVRSAMGMAARAAGGTHYVCPDDDAETATRRERRFGFRWLGW